MPKGSGIDPTPISLSYIAGFIDADGTFHIGKKKDTRGKLGYVYQPCLNIYNNDITVLKSIRSDLGIGAIGLSSGKTYALRIYRMSDISKILDLIIPYLRLKKERAILLKEWVDSRLSKASHHYTNKEEELAFQIGEMNRGGE